MSEEDEDVKESIFNPTTDESNTEEDWSPWDEQLDGFKPRPTKKIIQADGLPGVVAETPDRSDVPPLSRKTLVCMGDFSSFVVRDSSGYVIQKFDPKDVKRHPNGEYFVHLDQAEHVHGSFVVVEESEDSFLQVVEPIVPPCKHYVRQRTQFDNNPEARMVIRVCSARRSDGGAFMDLTDRLFDACTIREPRDLEAEAELDAFDELKIKQGEEREMCSIFAKETEDAEKS